MASEHGDAIIQYARLYDHIKHLSVFMDKHFKWTGVPIFHMSITELQKTQSKQTSLDTI